ncbi:hypothetical protein JKP88DRAFT_180232 [Tribonema minus]|uniref:Copper transporter n=1 Tax=Tribonema minus TaxID=303371 RepID=A0A835Z3M6_9STRA|nr:hypothetical protein JKP88DRAFT_180232 [Tribonema minus]
MDGTARRTLATTTNAGMPLPLPMAVAEACPRFAEAAERLRSAVDATGRAYANVLDQLAHGNALLESGEVPPFALFAAAASTAESLEHFHVFTHDTPAGGESHRHGDGMLPLHSDVGLFLVMTAAEYFQLESGTRLGHGTAPQTGLLVELPDGRRVRPQLAEGSLLVMNGEAATRWMDAGALRPHAPLHEVESLELTATARAWFGRMYFPPQAATLRGEALLPLTFGEHRQQTYEAFRSGQGHSASAVGCAPVTTSAMLQQQSHNLSAQRVLADEGSCGADEVYCWMSCMQIPAALTCSKADIVCINPTNGTLWPEDYMDSRGTPGHCYDCVPDCGASGAASSQGGAPDMPAVTSTSSFCNTVLSPTTMWMTGFQFMAGHAGSPCVVYLFPGWVLNSAVKFGIACVGSFLMGIAAAALTSVRLLLNRQFVPQQKGKQRLWALAGYALQLVVLAVQLTLGYWCMLVAMTYQAELFIMIVLGLAFGQLFNVAYEGGKGGAAADESPNVCCC